MTTLTFIQAIGEIIRQELKCEGLIRLEETAPGSSCLPVVLQKRGTAVVLKLDRPGLSNEKIFPLFRAEEGGLTALCDYIVFFQDKASGPLDEAPLFVFSCELKSGDPAHGRKQTENGCLLADYVIAMARHHKTVAHRGMVKHRGLVFSPRAPLPKTIRSRCEYQSPSHKIPEMRIAYLRAGQEYDLAYFCA